MVYSTVCLVLDGVQEYNYILIYTTESIQMNESTIVTINGEKLEAT